MDKSIFFLLVNFSPIDVADTKVFLFLSSTICADMFLDDL